MNKLGSLILSRAPALAVAFGLASALVGCGGTSDQDSSTTGASTDSSVTTTSSPTTSTSPTLETTTSTSSTMVETTRPTIIVNEFMAEVPAYVGDGFTYHYMEDPDPEKLGCEGFPQTRIWIQTEGDTAELLTEIDGAGSIYAGPNNRMLVVEGCEGFLGTIYHADVLPNGRLTNVDSLYIPIDSAQTFTWLDDRTVIALMGSYDAIWGDDIVALRNYAIDLDHDDFLAVTSPGMFPVIAKVTSCNAAEESLVLTAFDEESGGEVTFEAGTLRLADSQFDMRVEHPSNDFWWMFSEPDVNAIVSAPNCLLESE